MSAKLTCSGDRLVDGVVVYLRAGHSPACDRQRRQVPPQKQPGFDLLGCGVAVGIGIRKRMTGGRDRAYRARAR